MDLRGWDERYRSRERVLEDFEAAPAPLLKSAVHGAAPGKALDLACGTGRNALWLASNGWAVTAVDGSRIAIDVLRSRAREEALSIEARVADLEKGEYRIDRVAWNLIVMCYYLQVDLLESAKQGVVPGGIVLAIVHVNEPDEAPSKHWLRPGELEKHFQSWEILHSFEGQPTDPTHHRRVAEIVARRPAI